MGVLIRFLLVVIMAAGLTAQGQPLPAGRNATDRSHVDEGPAVALEQQVELLAAMGAREGALWPGFDPLAVPLAVYDGERTLLFRHAAPPPGFTPVSDVSAATYACKGRHEAVTANTNAEIGGIPTATVLLDRPQTDSSLLDMAAIAVHEAFHVYQRARHPNWIGNEGDLFTYPTDAGDLLALRRLETEALRQALAAKEATDAACWAREALALRGERYARMDSAFAAYERGTELNEGLATYVEMRAAGRRTVALPPAEFGPSEVRRRAYATGPALALLLDRFNPGWPAEFEDNDRQALDAALAKVLGPGATCTFDDALVAAAEERARRDVSALAVERARMLAAFAEKPGWVVVVEAGRGNPLWPQGFDPLNVQRVGEERLLHTRFLRLGNDAGQLEVLNAEALTEAVGPHPLFQGVRRVELTGLPQPEVRELEGKVTVRAPSLTVEFRGARVARSHGVVTVRLGS